MKLTGNFGAAANYELTSAILLYNYGASKAATVHPVRVTDGRPVIQPGTAVTREGVSELVRSLGQHIAVELLPECVLSVSDRHLVWWTPERRARIWFKAGEEKHPTPRALNGQAVNHPPLLFVATQGQALRVRALGRNTRPTAATRLYVAPYFNLAADGDMCVGSARLPAHLRPSALTKYENAFYQSAFSHSHGGHRLTRFPGGHDALWAAAQKKTFRAWQLVRTKETLHQLIQGLAQAE